MHPAASPDGGFLAFEMWSSTQLGGLASVKIARADGSAARSLGKRFGRSPSFSPDGSHVTLVYTEGLFLVSPAGNTEQLVRNWYVTDEVNEPLISPQAWSPNGLFILLSQRPDVGAGNPQEIWAIEVADGSYQRLVTPPSERPSMSIDGWLVFQGNIDGNYNIFVMDPAGNVFRGTTHSASDVKPVWSPDGSKILFVSNRDGNDEIYTMNRDGSNLTNLTRHPASQTDPYWVP